MSFFSPDSRLYKSIHFIGGLIVLNFLWILFSLPVVTIGASTTALYFSFFKLINNTDGYLMKDFLKGFKSNWKQGTALWFVTAIFVYGFYLDFQLLKNNPGVFVVAISVAAFIVVCFSLMYSYPLCVCYENKFWMHIKNSFLLSIRNIGKTLFLIFILAIEILIFALNRHAFIFFILVGPAVFIYTIAGTARKIFNSNKN